MLSVIMLRVIMLSAIVSVFNECRGTLVKKLPHSFNQDYD